MATVKITCIICAFNEEKRISAVLDVVSGHPALAEIIVVDDGSKDGTAEKASIYQNVTLLKHPVNKGKSEAFVTGMTAATGEYILMLDADLVNLTEEAITRLLDPVVSGEADQTMSLRKNSLFIYRWLGIDYVSGERVFKKSFLEGHLENMRKLPGYGLESYMNDLIIEKRLKLKVVDWPEVSVTNKAGKEGFVKGIIGEVRMVRQIVKLMTFRKVVHQIFALRALSRLPQI